MSMHSYSYGINSKCAWLDDDDLYDPYLDDDAECEEEVYGIVPARSCVESAPIGPCFLCSKKKPLQKLFRNCNHESACYSCLRNRYVESHRGVYDCPLQCFHPDCQKQLQEEQLKQFCKSESELHSFNQFVSLNKVNTRKFGKDWSDVQLIVGALGKESCCHCPNCSIIITKEYGCNHMQCSVCKTSFNWSTACSFFQARFGKDKTPKPKCTFDRGTTQQENKPPSLSHLMLQDRFCHRPDYDENCEAVMKNIWIIHIEIMMQLKLLEGNCRYRTNPRFKMPRLLRSELYHSSKVSGKPQLLKHSMEFGDIHITSQMNCPFAVDSYPRSSYMDRLIEHACTIDLGNASILKVFDFLNIQVTLSGVDIHQVISNESDPRMRRKIPQRVRLLRNGAFQFDRVMFIRGDGQYYRCGNSICLVPAKDRLVAWDKNRCYFFQFCEWQKATR